MKTMKAGAVVLLGLGLVLAAPAWGQKFERVPGGDPREFRMSGPITGGVCALKTSQNCSYFIYEDGPHYIGEGSGGSVAIFHHNSPDDGEKVRYVLAATYHGATSRYERPTDMVILPKYSTAYRIDTWIFLGVDDGGRSDVRTTRGWKTVRTGAEPEPETPTPPTPPEPEPPAPPPEPEPETPTPPTPPEPEPEAPDPEPEAPDHTHPVCDHLAIVPAMPRALSGDEDARDHWLRITNPGPEGIRFTIDGRDEAGVKAGTYRRELPAYRSVRVKMRDVEAAFDVADPEGWWWLKVAGSGPVDVAATLWQGDERRFVPVKVPATCPSGAVTSTR